MGRTVRRRTLATAPLVLVACRAAGTPTAPATDAQLNTPERVLALSAADLPGFTLREELAPASGAGADDPYGRVGSYSATFGRGTEGMLVTSSINTYVGAAQARTAFGAWKSAVPRQYRAMPLAVGLDERDSAAYARDSDGTVLLGYRIRNVMGSLRAPAADVERLARLVLARCIKG